MAHGAIVVTGASTGIGHATAVKLTSLGFRVFAGVRGAEDAERLEREGLEALLLDVTDAAAIADAARTVEERLDGQPLAGVVNNAGAVVTGPLELIELDELRRQLEVNAVAPVAVAQAFLPPLRTSKGRIVNISSIGGRVAQPFLGAYAMSKFAVEAMTDSLRRELLPWGIDVIAIEPGTIKTPMWEKGIADGDALLARMSEDGRALYGAAMEKTKEVAARQARVGVKPDRVAKAVAHALTAERPRTRYMVGDARVLAAVDALLPARVFDRLMGRFVA